MVPMTLTVNDGRDQTVVTQSINGSMTTNNNKIAKQSKDENVERKAHNL